MLRSRSGGIAVITALSLPILVGATAFTAQSVEWVWARRAMQRQADSAAIAGAFALSQSRSVATTVTSDLARNGNTAIPVTSLTENAPTKGAYAGNSRAVRVALTSNMPLWILSAFAGKTVSINVEATAAVVGFGEYCAIALQNTPVVGITMTGSTTVNLNCGMITNSPAADTVSAGGSSTIAASPIAAVGGILPSSNYPAGTQLFPYSVPQQDPYAGLPTPNISSSSNNGNVQPNQTKTLSPGNYSGMDLKGNVTLNPGVYYVDGSTFSANSGAIITGTGVTIILTSKTAASSPSSIAQLNLNGNATLNLTAPTTGPYAGILFYQDRRAVDNGGSNVINGNSGSTLQGAIYFPGQAISFTGNTGMNINCIKLVGYRLTFTGNSNVSNTCPAGSGVSPILGTRVKLVA